MAECRHDLSLCPDCGGLHVIEQQRLDVLSFRMDGPDGPIVTSGPGVMFLGRIDPCPNTPRETSSVRRN